MWGAVLLYLLNADRILFFQLTGVIWRVASKIVPADTASAAPVTAPATKLARSACISPRPFNKNQAQTHYAPIHQRIKSVTRVASCSGAMAFVSLLPTGELPVLAAVDMLP